MFELYTFIQNKVEVLEKVRTDVEFIAIFSKSKVSYSLVVYIQVLLLLVRLNRGCVMFKNLQINL